MAMRSREQTYTNEAGNRIMVVISREQMTSREQTYANEAGNDLMVGIMRLRDQTYMKQGPKLWYCDRVLKTVIKGERVDS